MDLNNLPGWVMAILIGGSFAAVVGILVARKSARKKPIVGGPLAQVFHYLGTVAMISPAPMLIVGAFIYRIDFGASVGLCLGGLGLGFVLLMVMAAFETAKRVV